MLVENQATTAQAHPEFPNIIGVVAELFHDNPVGQFLHFWESTIYSALVIILLAVVFYRATRKPQMVPARLQNFAELVVTFIDDFVCSILGPQGRKYTPFIGTLFIYILSLNLLGLVPFFKSPSSDWSNTAGLALIVFVYVQYTAFKELGFLGYVDHQMGKPRGIMAMTVIMPIFMLMLHLMGELIRPLSLSLRLRANILAEEKLLAVFANFGGLAGVGGSFVIYFLDIMGAVIQAVVFSVLTLIYFALVLVHDEEQH